jgi:hypothetical protein
MSTAGKCFSKSSVAVAEARSPANPSIFASGTVLRICFKAELTGLSERPFTITRAPSAASWLATAKPIPLVEPEMRAVLSTSSRFISKRQVWVDQPHDGSPVSQILKWLRSSDAQAIAIGRRAIVKTCPIGRLVIGQLNTWRESCRQLCERHG